MATSKQQWITWDHLLTRWDYLIFLFSLKFLIGDHTFFSSCPSGMIPSGFCLCGDSLLCKACTVGTELNQCCLAIPLGRKALPVEVETTPCGYLSASCNAADKSRNTVVKDNPLLTCPAHLLCSRTVNAIPKVLGGSFSMFMTRNKKMKTCVKLGKLQKPGRGWLSPEQFVSSKGTSEASFKNKKHPVLIPTICLAIIIAIWTNFPALQRTWAGSINTTNLQY